MASKLPCVRLSSLQVLAFSVPLSVTIPWWILPHSRCRGHKRKEPIIPWVGVGSSGLIIGSVAPLSIISGSVALRPLLTKGLPFSLRCGRC